MRTLCAVLLLALVFSPLQAQERGARTLTILYSASLNGNLDGCDCKNHPRAGLVKRAAWLRQLDASDRTLLVDTGDLLDPYPDEDLATAILDTYRELGYTAIAVGDQEFANGLQSLLRYRERYPLMAHNLTLCPDPSRCIFFSPLPQIIERNGLRIGLFALIDPVVFTLHPDTLKEKLKIQDPRIAAGNQMLYLAEQGAEITVVLYHGRYQGARELARRVPGLDVVIVGHDQQLIEAARVGETVIVSPGPDGNRMGILTLTVDSRGRVEHENRFRLFTWLGDADDPKVRRRIETYKQKLRERLSSG